MKRILIAVDGSEGALKAVAHAAEQIRGQSNLQITLFYVSPGVPPEMWDDGHILTEEETRERKAVLDKWLDNQKIKTDSVFRPAIEVLTKAGIDCRQVETKSLSETVKNTAECILAEARAGGYETLVLGRCGASRTTHALLGSTVRTILNNGVGMAVWVAE